MNKKNVFQFQTVEPNYASRKVQIAEKPFERTSVQEKEKQRNIGVTSKANEVDDKDKQAPSKNSAGPPVYYPPNHELFLNKEESASGYRSQVISVFLIQILLIGSSFLVLGWVCSCEGKI